jgi:hypothetical protein
MPEFAAAKPAPMLLPTPAIEAVALPPMPLLAAAGPVPKPVALVPLRAAVPARDDAAPAAFEPEAQPPFIPDIDIRIAPPPPPLI